MFLLLFSVLIFVLLLRWWIYTARILPNFPPGPYGLPLVGYWPIFKAENILAGLSILHQKFGPTFSLNIGPGARTVIIGDYETLKDAFKDDTLAARPPRMNWFNVYFRFGNGTDSRGILFSHGNEWSEQRRFSLRSLREFGFGKSSMEELIHEEVLQFTEELDNHLNHPISVKNKFNISIINGLWTIIAGKRFKLDDPELLDLVRKVDDMTAQSGNTNILQIFPSLRHFAPNLTNWNHTKAIMDGVVDFVGNVVNSHKTKMDRHPELKDEPEDFIDQYLVKVEASPAESSFHGTLGLQNLRSTVIDLLLAGSETTSTALTWAILFMIKYPEYQVRVQEELDRVIGNARLPLISDRPNLAFTESVVQEILRMSCIAPLGLPHFAQKDISILNGKFVIPAGTTVLPNLYNIINNPKQFPNPTKFNPDRFLDSDGKYVKNDHNVIFSIGKRDCLGKSLALTELFLFFSALMQKYSFKWSGGDEDLSKLSIKPKVGFTQVPPPYEVIVTKRNSVQ